MPSQVAAGNRRAHCRRLPCPRSPSCRAKACASVRCDAHARHCDGRDGSGPGPFGDSETLLLATGEIGAFDYEGRQEEEVHDALGDGSA
jgi:hypothetical protein